MTLRELFGIDKPRVQEPPEDFVVSTQPETIPGTGNLDPWSPTWLFIRNWAGEALQKAREKNDNSNNDIVQTAVLRGEIKILKELIKLPNPKPGRGLLMDEE